MSEDQMQSTRVDTRGFVYALAPYLLKQEWQLELLESRFALSQKALDAARLERERLDAVFAEQISHMQVPIQSHSHPNPQIHRRAVGYLAGLRTRMKVQDDGVEELRARRDELQEQLITQQRMIDGLIEHRADAFKAFVEEESRRQSAEADRDWIGRSISRPPLGTRWAHGGGDLA